MLQVAQMHILDVSVCMNGMWKVQQSFDVTDDFLILLFVLFLVTLDHIVKQNCHQISICMTFAKPDGGSSGKLVDAHHQLSLKFAWTCLISLNLKVRTICFVQIDNIKICKLSNFGCHLNILEMNRHKLNDFLLYIIINIIIIFSRLRFGWLDGAATRHMTKSVSSNSLISLLSNDSHGMFYIVISFWHFRRKWQSTVTFANIYPWNGIGWHFFLLLFPCISIFMSTYTAGVYVPVVVLLLHWKSISISVETLTITDGSEWIN